ncbi:hypothetical protein JK358_22155 [Nocardia sp. 2]|uniref:Uncharacterized protein n=1 Tax=Nocardia acididurans TaxID=2802282 RepID=A0ABS1M9X9_9NOCA|nr:hypothetical protein [Nocardia acididurans]MBL1077106.1 hypothetical protein [Nocardia acididurans]
MAGEAATTLHDYQLAMLHSMNTSAPAQAAELRARIGVTRIDTAIAEKRWFFAEPTNKFRSIAEYVAAWGTPISERVERWGEREVGYARWDLSFWPGLQIEFMEVHRGRSLFTELIRRPGMPQPSIGSVADLTPWSCTLGELQSCGLGPVVNVDGWGAAGVFALTAPDPDTGCPRHHFAFIDWGLLQSVEPAPDWYTDEQ